MILSKKTERHAIYRDELMVEIANEIKTFGKVADLPPMVGLVLRSLRDRMSFENSLQFLSLLPLPFKAMFVQGWNTKDTIPYKLEDFKMLVEDISSRQTTLPYEKNSRKTINMLVLATFKVIGHHVSRNDFERLLELMPVAIRMEIKEKAYPFFYEAPDTSIWLS